MDRNYCVGNIPLHIVGSLSARRAWIEISIFPGSWILAPVALRKESVDRNITNELLTALKTVALRKESVDRNNTPTAWYRASDTSLSARRAWIEMSLLKASKTGASVALRKESVDRNTGHRTPIFMTLSRSPQGERG